MFFQRENKKLYYTFNENSYTISLDMANIKKLQAKNEKKNLLNYMKSNLNYRVVYNFVDINLNLIFIYIVAKITFQGVYLNRENGVGRVERGKLLKLMRKLVECT